MKKDRILCFLIFFFSTVSSANELTLENYLDEVRRANPAIRSSDLRAQALEHRIKPIGTLDDPFIAAGIDQVLCG